MTLPKISLETIDATAAIATRQDIGEFAVSSMMNLMQEQPELTNLITVMLGTMVQGGENVEEVPAEFAQEMIIKASMVTYGLVMAAVKAQVEADELNEAWGK
jgi:hypothetical protein